MEWLRTSYCVEQLGSSTQGLLDSRGFSFSSGGFYTDIVDYSVNHQLSLWNCTPLIEPDRSLVLKIEANLVKHPNAWSTL